MKSVPREELVRLASHLAKATSDQRCPILWAIPSLPPPNIIYGDLFAGAPLFLTDSAVLHATFHLASKLKADDNNSWALLTQIANPISFANS